MRRILIFAILAMLAFTTTANAADQYTRHIESFDFFIDGSSGMSGGNSDYLGNVLRQINDKIPELGYPEAGIHTFAPENMVLDFEAYSRARFADGIDQLMGDFPNGGDSSLGKGLDYYASAYSGMLRKGAVIVFTDGEYGHGRDSLNEAKIFYLTQPQMCLHFVSFAQTEKAQQLIDDMAAISNCSVSTLASDLLNNEANTDEFVRRVFGTGMPAAAQEVVELPSEAPIIDFVMLSIPFGFDSAALDENTSRVADAVVERLRTDPAMRLKIDGFTCNIGQVDYNKVLSTTRAESVKNYLVNAGIEPSRIETQGFGVESPRYDNNTREGRSMNRRVEFTFY